MPWFITSLIKIDYSYYDSIRLPFFSPPRIFYPVAWTVNYILISISIYQILSIEKNKKYLKILLLNYLCNQSFQITFFLLKNQFLGFVSCITTFITTLFLYQETESINEKSTKYLDPYVLLSLFATILSLTIYVLNK